MIHITLKDMPGVLDENQIKMSNASWDEDPNYGGVVFSTHEDAQKAKALVERMVAEEGERWLTKLRTPYNPNDESLEENIAHYHERGVVWAKNKAWDAGFLTAWYYCHPELRPADYGTPENRFRRY